MNSIMKIKKKNIPNKIEQGVLIDDGSNGILRKIRFFFTQVMLDCIAPNP